LKLRVFRFYVKISRFTYIKPISHYIPCQNNRRKLITSDDQAKKEILTTIFYMLTGTLHMYYNGVHFDLGVLAVYPINLLLHVSLKYPSEVI